MANEDYEKRGSGDFCPVAELAIAVDYFTDIFSIKNLVGAEDEPLEVGMAALVDDEIVRVTEVGAGYVRVARGCADTIPAPHDVNALIWFYEETVGTDGREYAGGETVTAKVTPNTTSAVYPIENAPPNEITMNWRFSRPYAPGRMQQNSDPWFVSNLLSADEPQLVLTWAHRDRVVQADQLIDHFETSIGPEPGTTYFARIYKGDEPTPRRTEVGITGTSWAYQWSQALVDLDHAASPEGNDVDGRIEFGSYRDDLESWQFYTLPFVLNNQGVFLRAAQLGQMVVQEPDAESGFDDGTPLAGMFASSLSTMTIQQPDEGTGFDDTPLAGIFVSQLVSSAGQETSFYMPMTRTLFEAPYTYSIRQEGFDPATARVLTVAARPSDRLTDTQSMYSRIRPESGGAALPFEFRGQGAFTPWLTIATDLDYLTRTATIRTTSLTDGVPLTSVAPGQMAIINAEVVRVESISDGIVTIERGCADTTPARHPRNSRIWFFEAGCMMDTTPWPRPPVPRPAPADTLTHLEYKSVPTVLGPPLALDQVPTDRLALDQRKWRPFPPGQVTVNGQEWFKGAFAEPDKAIVIRWSHRNRITQGANILDHNAPAVAPEPGTTYRLSITVMVPPKTPQGSYVRVLVREVYVEGDRFDYTYEMAYSDGFRVARLLGVCGTVSVAMRLDAYRDGLDNWQGYSFMLRLPAPVCAPGQNPGGGSGDGGQEPGRGNGDNGNTPDYPPTGPGDDQGDDDPLNNGGGDNGGGPKPPDKPPVDWPDPVDPGPDDTPDPPPGEGRWDIAWDHFWAERTGDDPGGEGGN